MRKLRCINEKCPSNTGAEIPGFDIDITVGQDGELTEAIRKIPGDYFICIHCGYQAEWKEDEE